MGLSMTHKVIARKLGTAELKAGEVHHVPVDVVLLHEAGTTGTTRVLEDMGTSVLAPGIEIVVLPDHYVPPPTVGHATMHKITREFPKRWRADAFYEIGRGGICHQIMVENGHVRPGELIVATDSHATTYGALAAVGIGVGVTDMGVLLTEGTIWLRIPEVVAIRLEGSLKPGVSAKDLALEILRRTGTSGLNYLAAEVVGDGARSLSIDGRCCLCNMFGEAGVKSAVVIPDDKTEAYARSVATKSFSAIEPDDDAVYCDEIVVDLSEVVPMIATPSSPANGVPASTLRGVHVDQAFLGSCTNGRLEDLRIAADILKGHRVHEDTRLIVTPATQRIWLQAVREGLMDIFVESGALVTNPSCGACIGAQGVLAAGEVCISTSNRNFVARMGSAESLVYLAAPAAVAIAAIAGEIATPEDVGPTSA